MTASDSIGSALVGTETTKNGTSTDALSPETTKSNFISLSNEDLRSKELECFIRKARSGDRTPSPVKKRPQSVSSALTSSVSFTRILRLDLSRNKLTSLPKELFDMDYGFRGLQFLDVGRNELRELPSEIGNCTQLKSLVVLSNKLRWNGFPVNAISSLSKLERLDLRWNSKLNKASARLKLLEAFPQSKKLELILTPMPSTEGEGRDLCPRKKLSACDRNANELQSQLEPLSTPQLRKRLLTTFGVRFDDDNNDAYDREVVMKRIVEAYRIRNLRQCKDSGTHLPIRSIQKMKGVPIDPNLYRTLFEELRKIRWPRTTRERPKISAEGYIILQRPSPSSEARISKRAMWEAEKVNRYIGIWTKALTAIAMVDPIFAQQFTALAVTKNFKGSPHIDTLNIAPFYGISLGDFNDDGGFLCVECTPTSVANIDTRGRFAKVDGRFCHWVSDYVGTRYSLIFYVTHGEVVPQTKAVHTQSSD